MTAVVILNVVLATVVVAAILSLLGWGIFTDKAVAGTHSRRARTAAGVQTGRTAQRRQARGARRLRVTSTPPRERRHVFLL